jgi:hypothetical protein
MTFPAVFPQASISRAVGRDNVNLTLCRSEHSILFGSKT